MTEGPRVPPLPDIAIPHACPRLRQRPEALKPRRRASGVLAFVIQACYEKRPSNGKRDAAQGEA